MLENIKKELKEKHNLSAEEFYTLWEKTINSPYVKIAIKEKFDWEVEKISQRG